MAGDRAFVELEAEIASDTDGTGMDGMMKGLVWMLTDV